MIRKLETLLKTYAKNVETAVQNIQAQKQNLSQNYRGELLQKLNAEATAEYETTVFALKENVNKCVDRIIQEINTKIDGMINTDTGKLAKLQNIRGMKLSSAEIESLAKSNKDDYLCMRLLSTIASENGFRMSYTSIDDLQRAVAEMTETSKAFIKDFDGTKETKSYSNMCIILPEHPFENYENFFDTSTISVENKPRAELTPEQKTTLKSLFDGHDDVEARSEQLKELGLPDVDRLRADYYVMVSEGEA